MDFKVNPATISFQFSRDKAVTIASVETGRGNDFEQEFKQPEAEQEMHTSLKGAHSICGQETGKSCMLERTIALPKTTK